MMHITNHPSTFTYLWAAELPGAPGGDCAQVRGQAGAGVAGRGAQPALVIVRHYITERDSAPVQHNGIV